MMAENTKEDAIRRELKALFKDTTLADTIADLSDEELMAVAPTLRKGVSWGRRWFDGSRGGRDQGLVEAVGLPESGKTYCTTA